MKIAIVSALTAIALTVAACSHMSQTAGRNSIPVASLTADQIRAELAFISEELSDISRVSGEDLKRARTQTRLAGFNAGKIGRAATVGAGDGTLEGSIERQTINSSRRLGKVEKLRKRQDELRAQLATIEQPG